MKTKIKRFLQQYNGVWSVPLLFALFWLVGIILNTFCGTAGYYDLAFIQPLFLAMSIIMGASTAAMFCIRFTQLGLYRWFYGEKEKEANEIKVINRSRREWRELSAFQKFKLYFFVFFAHFALIVIVYMKMV